MKKIIMVVDDEKMVRKTLETVFRGDGFEVRTASSGSEAIEILKKEDIRVLFSDLKMPDMSGVELCREVKKMKPIFCAFAMTGFVTDFHVERCREAGFDDFFSKPFNIEVILKAAHDAFEKLERWDDPKCDIS